MNIFKIISILMVVQHATGFTLGIVGEDKFAVLHQANEFKFGDQSTPEDWLEHEIEIEGDEAVSSILSWVHTLIKMYKKFKRSAPKYLHIDSLYEFLHEEKHFYTTRKAEYNFVPIKMTYTQAQQHCKNIYSHLPQFHTQWEINHYNSYAKEMMRRNKDFQDGWVGARKNAKGEWRTEFGNFPNGHLYNWAKNEPNSPENECIHINNSGDIEQFRDADCEWKFYFSCQYFL